MSRTSQVETPKRQIALIDDTTFKTINDELQKYIDRAALLNMDYRNKGAGYAVSEGITVYKEPYYGKLLLAQELNLQNELSYAVIIYKLLSKSGLDIPNVPTYIISQFSQSLTHMLRYKRLYDIFLQAEKKK